MSGAARHVNIPTNPRYTTAGSTDLVFPLGKLRQSVTNQPTNPQLNHLGWQGWGHWLGTGNISGGQQRDFLPLNKARVRTHSLKLNSEREWNMWRKTGARPANVPSDPHAVCQHSGWQDWGHWLGTGKTHGGNRSTVQRLPFAKALLYARFLNLKDRKAWGLWRKSSARPTNIPHTPARHAGTRGGKVGNTGWVPTPSKGSSVWPSMKH